MEEINLDSLQADLDSQPADYDSPWKQIIEELLESFLEFFFPAIYVDIDFSRGYEVMSKELYKLLKDQNIGKRYTDELIKVFLKDGTEKWLLIHIEVQNYKEKEFARRMYIYNYRIFDKYAHEVVSLVIFTDPEISYRPDMYQYKRWDFELFMRYPVIKIIDFRNRIMELEQKTNPMAILVLAQLKHIEIQKSDAAVKYDIKLTLTRMLYRKGFTKKQIIEIFKFIDWLIELPANLEKQLSHEMIVLEKEYKMTYVTHFERIAKTEGKLEGKLDIVEKLLKRGFPIKDIMDITGLAEKEILALKEKG